MVWTGAGRTRGSCGEVGLVCEGMSILSGGQGWGSLADLLGRLGLAATKCLKVST